MAWPPKTSLSIHGGLFRCVGLGWGSRGLWTPLVLDGPFDTHKNFTAARQTSAAMSAANSPLALQS